MCVRPCRHTTEEWVRDASSHHSSNNYWAHIYVSLHTYIIFLESGYIMHEEWSKITYTGMYIYIRSLFFIKGVLSSKFQKLPPATTNYTTTVTIVKQRELSPLVIYMTIVKQTTLNLNFTSQLWTEKSFRPWTDFKREQNEEVRP